MPAGCSSLPAWSAWPMRRCRSTSCSARSPASAAPRRCRRTTPRASSPGEMTVRFDSNVAQRPGLDGHARRSRSPTSIGKVDTVNFIGHQHTRTKPITGHGDLQRLARTGRRLLQQDRMLLLHRADPAARRNRATCRSCSSSIPSSIENHRARHHQRDHALLYLLRFRQRGKLTMADHCQEP